MDPRDEASDGVAALRLVQDHDPDLMLLDLSMPDLDGLEVLNALGGGLRPTVAVLTGFEDPRPGERVLAAGASAYLTKGLRSASSGIGSGRSDRVSPGGSGRAGTRWRAVAG